MHLNEKAKQFPFLLHIMQHCPSLYFVLFQSCHANKPNFKNKTIKKHASNCLFSPSHAVSAGRNPFPFLPSYFRCFYVFPNCGPVSLWFPSCPGNKPWFPFPQHVVFTIPWSYCFPKYLVVGFFSPKLLQKWEFSFSVPVLGHPLSFTQSECIGMK